MVQYLPFFVTESQIVVKKCSPVFCSSVSCYPAFMHPDLRRRVWAHMKSGLMKGLCNMFSIKNPRYKILEENYLLDQQEYRSFGIQYDGGMVKDLSVDRSKVKRLVDQCNRLCVSERHLQDVVDDFLIGE